VIQRRWIPIAAAVGGVALLCAATRLISLRALPIFGDEAIFLRIAALIRRDPGRNLWMPLREASPPLHPWLLALVLPRSGDPVYAGRLLSAFAAFLTVPAAAWTAWRISEAFRDSPERDRIRSSALAIAVCSMIALCPFFVFAQRLARVDALFLLESTLAAGLSVELARRARDGANLLPPALGYGFLMGLTMLTRQAVSYPLWLLAPLAWILLGSGRDPSRKGKAGRLAAAFTLSLVIAGALWAPMLAAPGETDLMTRIFHASGYRPPMGANQRAHLFLCNAALAAEAFWVYLTPPVCVAALGGALALAAKKRLRLLGFLLSWEMFLIAPAALFAASYFPRYALPAALPVLVSAGFGLAGVLEAIHARFRSPIARAALGSVLACVLLGLSLRELWRGERGWRQWTLLAIDHEQFISGWSAGFASEAAARFLREAAARRPVVVLTPEFSGNPTDAIWLLLGSERRVRLSYAVDALRRPLLPRVGSQTYLLPGDVREGTAPSTVTLKAGDPVYVVATDPLLTRAGWAPALSALAGLNPELREAARFENPPQRDGRVESAVVVLRLR
jgi:hypothetical protein